MKKFFAAIFLLLILSSVSYAAASEDIKVQDVYVRQDVFDAKMEALFLRLHSEIENLGNKINGRIDSLSAEMSGNLKELSARIDSNYKELSVRIDGVEKRIDGVENRIDGVENRIDDVGKRIDTTNTFFYYLLVMLGIIIGLPYVNKWLEGRSIKNQQPSTTQSQAPITTPLIIQSPITQPSVTIEDVKRLIAEAKLGGVPQV